MANRRKRLMMIKMIIVIVDSFVCGDGATRPEPLVLGMAVGRFMSGHVPQFLQWIMLKDRDL